MSKRQPSEKTGMRADQVLAALQKKHQGDYFLTEVKTGPTQYVDAGTLQKLDGLAIAKSWANPCFSGYEVKVARSDFMGDTKWANYRNYCHRFYFACPSGLIKPEELPEDVGLVWVNEQGGWSVRRAALFRPIEIPWEMLYYIIMSKLDDERYPFFNSRYEFFKAYLEDKHDKYHLAFRVSKKWAADMEAMEKRVAEAERKVKDAEVGMKTVELLKQFGIDVTGWRGEFSSRQLVERLQVTTPPDLLRRLRDAESAIEHALQLVLPKKVEGGGDAA